MNTNIPVKHNTANKGSNHRTNDAHHEQTTHQKNNNLRTTTPGDIKKHNTTKKHKEDTKETTNEETEKINTRGIQTPPKPYRNKYTNEQHMSTRTHCKQCPIQTHDEHNQTNKKQTTKTQTQMSHTKEV